MGRYERSIRKEAKKKSSEPHPVWQGIGCLIAIILPVISYALADVTIDIGIAARWWFLPHELLGAPRFPDFVWKYWLGVLVLGVLSPWLPLFQIPLYWSCILYGLQGVLCMLGLVGLGNLLACWLTIYC